ncbi:MAG: DUF1156 domain-containing protein [Deltaproteobacteria bacterium]|nr:DUF1156 domain-containing protein [Deltaproteobacteria bacterium]
MNNDKRLIEDYLPIKAISAEASREKSIRKGHISTLHLWWARRTLVACRAAVYGALVPADQFQPQNGPESTRGSLGRANAAKFMERLCQYPGHPGVIKEAERHILEAHAQRLTEETGQKVTREDIEAGRAPRPKVLDMFAGGGAIPLEALRLGCEAYALDLNPVAYLWTRTVTCKNPVCGATVPLVKQTWLCKKKGRYVALKMLAPPGENQVSFEVVEAASEKGLGFDPTAFSSGGNATCPFCGTVADSAYVKAEGCTKRIGQQAMAAVSIQPGKKGKVYLFPSIILYPVIDYKWRKWDRKSTSCRKTWPREGMPVSARSWKPS